jgi:UDP-glucose 4-epimerase
MVKAAMAGKPFSVFGNDYDTRDGSCVRDFVHVIDLADAHLLGLRYITQQDVSGSFNLGSGTGFTVLEMIHALSEVSGTKVPYAIAGRREGDPASLVASNEKAKAILGWAPKHSDIQMILKDAWNWDLTRKY